MKFYLILLLLLITSSINAQNIVPFVDFNGYFKSFENGFFKQIQIQQIKNYKASDNVVGFYDTRSNLMVYDGIELKQLCAVQAEYKVSDNLLTWYLSETLNLWDDGELQTLSYNCTNYQVKDSVVVFVDNRFRTLNVYYDGEVVQLSASVNNQQMADFVGENIVVFRDNGNVYKVFWRGEIFELDVWHDQIFFAGDTDILAFNDPMTGTFAVFENGQFLDLEDFHMGSHRAGNNFIIYENRNSELIHYQNGEKTTLTNFSASYWDVKDNVVLWVENGLTYAFSDGEKKEIARFEVENYELKNDIIVFNNLLGGVSAYIDGEVVILTDQIDAKFEVFGNTVLVELFNKSFIVYQNGKKYYT